MASAGDCRIDLLDDTGLAVRHLACAFDFGRLAAYDLDGRRWTPALRAALQTTYLPAGDMYGFWLYRPRS